MDHTRCGVNCTTVAARGIGRPWEESVGARSAGEGPSVPAVAEPAARPPAEVPARHSPWASVRLHLAPAPDVGDKLTYSARCRPMGLVPLDTHGETLRGADIPV